MPKKPMRGCFYPGCPDYAVEGSIYCKKHKRIDNRNYDMYERSAEVKKKYGSSWRHIRNSYVRDHPLCEKCLSEGRYVPAQEVHHIIPVKRGGTHSTDNLMSLCHSCHEKIHYKMGDR